MSRIVLRGFTAFDLDDALAAGCRLLQDGAVRLKPTRERGSRGQSVVHDRAGLEEVLANLDASELQSHGLVLEENLTEVTTYSAGVAQVAGIQIAYCGIQNLARDNANASVYGGSDLFLIRGDLVSTPSEIQQGLRRSIPGRL